MYPLIPSPTKREQAAAWVVAVVVAAVAAAGIVHVVARLA